ncbi:ATP-binding protein [Actinomadura rudentiformis]|uniref:ATP-binding protein n=2 Tax=Actinomadura rudentiformis TaxID=359158 RepID=A0A6H9YFF2_9ACTN|nr:ATP-binding protein [Actinomadura rudentiformis]KAB2340359.1 ATP-binding protein [Actinomadura rudentiformis]
MLDPLARLPNALRLAEQGKYFVVHAPRQTGKTTALRALAHELNGTGRYAAVRVSCERAAGVEDLASAQEAILEGMHYAAEDQGLTTDCRPPGRWPEASPLGMVFAALRAWARKSSRPLVLLFDEIDALAGPALVSVLRQLRDGATSIDTPFPHSVVLCGMRNVRDYKAASGGDPTRLGTQSPFNISVESMRIGDFGLEEVAELYGQHTEATGQAFTGYAIQRAFEASQGQPWLLNALARDIIEEMSIPVEQPITDSLMEQAVERLIVQRATHLDSLVARLSEPRVRRIIEPMIIGGTAPGDVVYNDDLAYVRDLGLIARTRTVQIANPIYQETVVRALTQLLEINIQADPQAFLLPDGRLDIARLLNEFTAWWKANGEIIDTDRTYHEAACHLIFMAFLQRVVNGGGHIDREYALGKKRLDLTIRKPYTDETGQPAIQWSAFELKVRSDVSGDQIKPGLEQLDAYLGRLGLDTGTLLVFDRRTDAPPITARTGIDTATSPSGRTVTLIHA